jgi:hypothetical protein
VFFRAESFTAAGNMLAGMVGMHGVGWASALPVTQLPMGSACAKIAVVLVLVFFCPNVRELFTQDAPTINDVAATRTPLSSSLSSLSSRSSLPPLHWQPSTTYALGYSSLFMLCLFNMERVSEFLYFQF